MIRYLLIVGIGSFFGGVLRYYISTLMKNIVINVFTWGILTVNLLGCFIFGILFALFNKYSSTSTSWCLLLTTGFCGGFTTFSTFANDSLQMLQNGNVGSFIIYVLTSIVVGIVLIALGYYIVK